MSYYNIYPDPTIDYLVCNVCDAATFTWLAHVFPCAVCGSASFASPESTSVQPIMMYSEEDIQHQLLEEHRKEIRRHGTGVGEIDMSEGDGSETVDGGRKRKRSGDDDDHHHHHRGGKHP
ncbi:hypothetical protein PTNB73_03951 [Pyrenophora teres f. teres]|uniref:Uncharacterized protein n=1 Tax=Pyrenophora teres f. teres (strain 0-1) TaxID=861557 RepID=E3RQC6_PYRTT|nr:hypothetical protein PTT_10906 [Pyrenophora teres f. teres 0-1]KAE8838041.1 hypothetical protein PTNB85_05376 [Pyrenophora teres f. teres]KAE8839538.1 hypothetical protein HRS9122_06143 [Pyrenophora teres f. teres]KAE8868898.1 hypothetical protein PTNB73_03951 [Pyrenophora teres f. teres]